MIPRIYLYAAGALLLAAALWWAHHTIWTNGYDAAKDEYSASLAKANAAWQAKLNTATTRTAELESQLATQSRQLTGRVRDLESDLATALHDNRGRVRLNTCRDLSATARTAAESADTAEGRGPDRGDAAAFARDASEFAGDKCEQDRLTVLVCNEYARLIERWRAEMLSVTTAN